MTFLLLVLIGALWVLAAIAWLADSSTTRTDVSIALAVEKDEAVRLDEASRAA